MTKKSDTKIRPRKFCYSISTGIKHKIHLKIGRRQCIERQQGNLFAHKHKIMRVHIIDTQYSGKNSIGIL